MSNTVASVIKKFVQGFYSKEVTRDVLRWLVSSEQRKEKEEVLRSIWNDTKVEEEDDLSESLRSIYAKIGTPSRESNLRFSGGWMQGAAAAILILLTVGITLYTSKRLAKEPQISEYFSPATSIRKIALPDGSIAVLNSGSHIFISNDFKGKSRTVFLVGEACFKVKKDTEHPFIVRSATMSVTALGTEFNVAAYPESGSIVATLIEGKVKVLSESDRKEYLLDRGEQVVFDKKLSCSKMQVTDLEVITAWQKGEMIFRGATFEEILTSMERYYNISFRYNVSKFNNDKYNFRIYAGTSPEEALSILQLVTGGFNYKKEGMLYSVYK